MDENNIISEHEYCINNTVGEYLNNIGEAVEKLLVFAHLDVDKIQDEILKIQKSIKLKIIPKMSKHTII